jgi:hypothetical protein
MTRYVKFIDYSDFRFERYYNQEKFAIVLVRDADSHPIM